MGCCRLTTHLVVVRNARSDHPSGRRLSRSSAVTSNLLLPRLRPLNRSSKSSRSMGTLMVVRRMYPFSGAVRTESFCPISSHLLPISYWHEYLGMLLFFKITRGLVNIEPTIVPIARSTRHTIVCQYIRYQILFN